MNFISIVNALYLYYVMHFFSVCYALALCVDHTHSSSSYNVFTVDTVGLFLFS